MRYLCNKKDDILIHIDIIEPDPIQDEKIIHSFGKDYLQSKNQANQPLTAQECRFRHNEKATDKVVLSIQQNR